MHVLPERGFTTAAKCVVNCVVPTGFTEFVAKVAADDSSPAGQRMIFNITADGRSVARSTALAPGDPPQNLHIPLAGSRNLVLRIETATNATPEVRGRWIQAFFLRR
jgi:hypothetical protein